MKFMSRQDITEAYLNGSTIGIQTTKDQKGNKTAIFENTLILIRAKDIVPLAIRATPKLIIKAVGLHALINYSPLHIQQKCKDRGICIMSVAFNPIKKEDFENTIRILEKKTIEKAGEHLLQFQDNEINKQQRELKNNHNRKKSAQTQIEILTQLITSNERLREDKVPMSIPLLLFNLKTSRRILQKIDEYLEVCITLPEIISPGITGREETLGDITPAPLLINPK